MDKVKNFWNGSNNDHPYLNRASASALFLALITATALTALFLTQTQFIAFASQFSTLHFWGAYGVITSAVILPTTALLLALFFQNKKPKIENRENVEETPIQPSEKQQIENNKNVEETPIQPSEKQQIENNKNVEQTLIQPSEKQPTVLETENNFFLDKYRQYETYNYDAQTKAADTVDKNFLVKTDGNLLDLKESRQERLRTAKAAFIFKDTDNINMYHLYYIRPSKIPPKDNEKIRLVIADTREIHNKIEMCVKEAIKAGNIDPKNIVYTLEAFLAIADNS